MDGSRIQNKWDYTVDAFIGHSVGTTEALMSSSDATGAIIVVVLTAFLIVAAYVLLRCFLCKTGSSGGFGAGGVRPQELKY